MAAATGAGATGATGPRASPVIAATATSGATGRVSRLVGMMGNSDRTGPLTRKPSRDLDGARPLHRAAVVDPVHRHAGVDEGVGAQGGPSRRRV